jgi:hypothetical protein
VAAPEHHQLRRSIAARALKPGSPARSGFQLSPELYVLIRRSSVFLKIPQKGPEPCLFAAQEANRKAIFSA